MPDPDPLDELRARIRETQDAAQRLAGEAASARAQAAPPPGWTEPEDQARRARDVASIMAVLESLRDLIPEDLREQFRELVHQVLLLARALIDWWVDRTQALSGSQAPRPGPSVQDIPVA